MHFIKNKVYTNEPAIQNTLTWKNALEELITAIRHNDDIHFQNVATLPTRTLEGDFGLDAITIHGPYLVGRIIEANKIDFFKIFIGNGKRWDRYYIYHENRSIEMKSYIIWHVSHPDRAEMRSYLETYTNWFIDV